jgi:N-methylhydantoinase B/oxoprolinase/acetone carboxylase alpha subunit
MGRYRVSMDIGETFTDVVAYDEERGTYTAGKASTTPRDLTEGVFAGLQQVIDSPKATRLVLKRGDVIRGMSGGGGGFGDPAERDPELVRTDVRDGQLTPGAAASVYGATEGS